MKNQIKNNRTINGYILNELKEFLYAYDMNEDKSIFYEAAIYSLKQEGIFWNDRRELTTVFRLIENIEDYHYLKDILYYNIVTLYTNKSTRDNISWVEAIDFIETTSDIQYEILSTEFSSLIGEEQVGFQSVFILKLLNEYNIYNVNLNKIFFIIWDLIRNDYFE